MKLFALLVGYVQSAISKVGNAVKSVNGKTGEVHLTASDVGAATTARGLPTGGTTGQIMIKKSATNYDVEWVEDVEYSTSGNWTIAKYHNGEAECWCEDTQSHAMTAAMGSLYHSTSKSVSLPANLFIAAPIVNANTKAGGFTVGVQISNVSTSAITYGVINANSNTVNFIVLASGNNWRLVNMWFRHFVWKCFPVLPLVYDDTLSFYELLSKMGKKINEVISALLEMRTVVDRNSDAVLSVNNTKPDDNGNVNLPQVSGVTSVCGVGADGQGNVAIDADDVGAIPKSATTFTDYALTINSEFPHGYCYLTVNGILGVIKGAFSFPTTADFTVIGKVFFCFNSLVQTI